jgi:hypothetical protein
VVPFGSVGRVAHDTAEGTRTTDATGSCGW